MSIKRNWKGYYLDGKTADKQPVEIQLLDEGLRISNQSNSIFLWKYREIKQTQGFYSNEPVQLERAEGNIPEILIINDQDFLASLHYFIPKNAKKFHNPAFRTLRLRLVLYAAIGLIAIGTFTYVWGIPLLAGAIAPHVPLAWEKGMGQSILNIMAPEKSRCKDEELNHAIEQIVARLNISGSSHYEFKVFVVNSPIFNALALPGGNIIVFSGLLEKIESPESLAAVLAHEMQHIKKRHITKRVIKDSSTGVMLSAVSGDVTGSMLYGMKMARTLATLSYSRQDEEEADAEGIKMMIAANLDPEAMVSFFQTIKEKNAELKVPQYISTHPDTEQRIVRIKSLKAQLEKNHHFYTELLVGKNWNEIKKACSVPAVAHAGRNCAP
ncbi:MAG: M48 family metallopeptidase [Smithella sp.]